jgi:hypothetical protein
MLSFPGTPVPQPDRKRTRRYPTGSAAYARDGIDALPGGEFSCAAVQGPGLAAKFDCSE